jgi:hypothetical protein
MAEKQKQWLGAEKFYTKGDGRSSWRFRDDPRAVALLHAWLERAWGYLERFQEVTRANWCESFNALRARMCSKDTTSIVIFRPLTMATALRWNYGLDYVADFCGRYGIELDEERLSFLVSVSSAMLRRREHDENAEMLKRHNQRRLDKKARNRALARSGARYDHQARDAEAQREIVTFVSVAMRSLSRMPQASGLFDFDSIGMTIARSGIANPLRATCHFGASFELLASIAKVGRLVVAPDSPMQAFMDLLAVAAEGSRNEVDPTLALEVLGQASEFALDYLLHWQDPSDTVAKLLALLKDCLLDGQRFGDSFSIAARFMLELSCGHPAQPATVAEDLCVINMFTNELENAFLDPHGRWLLSFASEQIVKCECELCARLVDGARVGANVERLPEFIIINSHATVLGADTPERSAMIPLEFHVDVPGQAAQETYWLWGFIQVENHHAVCWIRVGPASLRADTMGEPGQVRAIGSVWDILDWCLSFRGHVWAR